MLEGEEARAWRTYRADLRAFMVMRGYITTALRIEVTYPDDPPPYVYVSTRTPERLAQALIAAGRRTAQADGPSADAGTPGTGGQWE
ncbi:DUF3093 family protein [Streptomyces sp. Inha503]|uniref:DUF3093 family protein n=1 Tax=Streptomyces sp. Inha503 TaxID=3383314 RepID=UPI0039A373A4